MYKFLLIIVMCLFIILLYFCKKIPEYFQNNEIPKIIWTYWDTDEIPEIVKLSIQSWKKTSPQYKINLMNQKILNLLYHYRIIGKHCGNR